MLNKATKGHEMSLDVKQSVTADKNLGFLIGRYEHALDPKRRLTVPALWRDQMGSPESLYVIPDPHSSCLNLLSPAEMAARMERVRQRALFDKSLSQSLRILGENSEQVMLDVQGRVRIRDRLLAFAKLSEKVVMIGECNRIELWAPELRPEADISQEALAEACANLFTDL